MAKAGVLTIDVNAGTAQFIMDMDRANAKLKQFGDGAGQAGHGVTSAMQSSSAAIRLLENPLGNNIRAVERFITLLPGMSKLLQAAFPIVGAIAFADILVKMGGEAVAFFQKIQEAPVKLANAFRELNAPITLSNDELALANDRLKAELATLNGKPGTNTLAIMLDEARVNSDRLGESLDKNLGALQKLLKENGTGWAMSLLTGSRSTSGEGKDIEKLNTDRAVAQFTAQQNSDKATTPEAKVAALIAGEIEQRRLVNAEITRRNALLKSATDLQQQRDHPKPRGTGAGDFLAASRESGHAPGIPDQTNYINTQKKIINDLRADSDEIQARIDNASLTSDVNKARAAKTTAEQQAQLRLADLDNQEKTNASSAALARQKAEGQIAAEHNLRQAQIAAEPDAKNRVVMEAAEEVRVEEDKATKLAAINQKELNTRIKLLQARVAPESVGKTDLQQQAVQKKITGPGGDVDQAKAQAAQTALAMLIAVDQAEQKLETAIVARNREEGASWDEVTREAAKAAKERRAALNESIGKVSEEALKRNTGENVAGTKDDSAVAKGQGEIATARLKAQYEEQGVHTLQQEITYRQQLAAIEDQAYTAELTSLGFKLKAAEALDDELEKTKQVLEIQAQMVALSGKAQASNIGNAGQTQTLQNQDNLRVQADQDLKGALMQLPEELGNALSRGIFDHGKGQSIGKDVGQSLKGAGEQLTGKLLSAGLNKLAETAIKQFGLQAIFNSLFPTVQTGQTTAITGAIGLSTTSIVAAITGAGAAGAAGGAAGGIAGAAGGIAGAAGSGASSLATGMMGPLISAAGGIIGGIISGVMSLIGDNRIVKAVDGTTAAVLSLRGNLGSTTQNGVTTSTASNPLSSTAISAQMSSGSFWQSLLSPLGGVSGLLKSAFGFSGIGSLLGIDGIGSTSKTTGTGGTTSQPVPVSLVSISPMAGIAGLFSMFGFDEGGPVTHDMVAKVHKGEHVLNADQVAGRAPLPGFLRGAQFPSTEDYMQTGGSQVAPRDGDNFGGNHTFHIYESGNARETAAQVARHLTTMLPSLSKYAR